MRLAGLQLLLCLAGTTGFVHPKAHVSVKTYTLSRAVPRVVRTHPAVLSAPEEGLSAPEEATPPPIQLYPYRWVQLGYLSLLALLSDWVCFSVAAAPETWVTTYNHDPATLIDIFLFTNVLFCFLEPSFVRKLGLRGCVVGAGVLMAAGCALRSGLPFTGTVPPYAEVVAGTVLVGAAQPFFQCTPPLLSATWFGADERALATAVAINFNQVGIASAFLVGGVMAGSTTGLAHYFDLLTGLSLVVAIGAFLQFKARPPLPVEHVTHMRSARLARAHELLPPRSRRQERPPTPPSSSMAATA